MNEKRKNLIFDIAVDIIGSAIYAAGIDIFTEPNDIAPGGVTGLATMIHSMTGLQIGMLSFLLNLPLLVLGFMILGKKVMFRTFRTLAIYTVIVDGLDLVRPEYTGDPLIAAISGGAAIGVGLGLIFLRGSTTGGTDILGRIILRWFPHIPLGKILLVIDCVIVAAAGFYYRTMEAALYALVAIYITERGIDAVLYGSTEGQAVYIISDRYEEITARIIVEADRGITLLDGEGGYSGFRKKVILCAIPARQFGAIRKIVNDIDPAAFIIASPTRHIIGEGFKQTFE